MSEEKVESISLDCFYIYDASHHAPISGGSYLLQARASGRCGGYGLFVVWHADNTRHRALSSDRLSANYI